MDTYINIIGLLGSVAIALSLFPQSYRTVKEKKVKDLSLLFICITMVGAGCQLIYGIYYDILPMIIANTCVVLNTVILLVSKNILNHSTIIELTT